jgi:SSS family solute:Na+ symporter
VIDGSRLLELTTLTGYLALLMWIGLRSARQVKTSLDYTVAGRDVAWVVVLATTAATMVGGGASIGSVADVYTTGITFALITCAWHIQLIVTGFLIAPRLRAMNLLTVAEFFGQKFGELARQLAVVNCLIFLVGALVAQLVAMGKITQTVLDIPYPVAVLGGAAVVVYYSTVGGIRAVVKTDVLQFVILVGGIGAAAGYLYFQNGGFEGIVARVGPQPFQVINEHWSGIKIGTMFAAFLLGEMLVPPYAVRCFIARDSQQARWGVAGAGIFLLLFLPIAIFVLGVSAQADPEVVAQIEKQQSNGEADAQIVFPTLMRRTFPPVFAGVMIAALIAAVMSSGDSCLSCISTIVMEDIYRTGVDCQASDQTLLRVARYSTLFTGVVAAVCACLFSDIVKILSFVYDFWAPTMVFPFLVGIFWYQRHRIHAVVAAMISGFLGAFIWRFFPGFIYRMLVYMNVPVQQKTIDDFQPALAGLLISLVAFLVALPLTSRRGLSRFTEPLAPAERQG